MNEFVSVAEIAENGAYGAQKAVRDEVAQMEFGLRRTMDQGLPVDQMQAAEAVRDGINAANEILEKLFK